MFISVALKLKKIINKLPLYPSFWIYSNTNYISIFTCLSALNNVSTYERLKDVYIHTY